MAGFFFYSSRKLQASLTQIYKTRRGMVIDDNRKRLAMIKNAMDRIKLTCPRSRVGKAGRADDN